MATDNYQVSSIVATTAAAAAASAVTTTTTNSESAGLGSVSDPLWTAIPMTILYVLILVTGVIGNVLTCVVIVRNRYMHTATNYYLFSLAISDLLLLVLGLPQEIYQIWHRYPYVFGEAFCILRGFSSEASTNSSVLTITAFTMERYVAICHPLKAHTMSKLSRAVKLIVIIWLLGFLCAAPIAYQFGIVYDYLPGEVSIPQSAACNIKRPVPYLEEHIFALQSLIVFVLPVTWISVLYTLIGIKLRQSSRQTSNTSTRSHFNQQSSTNEPHRRAKRLRSICTSKTGSFSTTEEPPNILQNDLQGDHSKSSPPPSQQQQGNNEINESKSSKRFINKNKAKNKSSMKKCQPNARMSIDELDPLPISSNNYSNTNNSKCRRKMSKLKSTSSTISNTSSSQLASSGGNSLAQRRAVIKMLTAVVVAFFVCFAPFHAQRLMAIYVKNPSQYETVAFTLLTYISGVTYYLSATINPILYSIMSVRFRQAFHDTFVRTFCASISDHISKNHHGRSGRQPTISKPHLQNQQHSTYVSTYNQTPSTKIQNLQQQQNKPNIVTATISIASVTSNTTKPKSSIIIEKNLVNHNNDGNKDHVSPTKPTTSKEFIEKPNLSNSIDSNNNNNVVDNNNIAFGDKNEKLNHHHQNQNSNQNHFNDNHPHHHPHHPNSQRIHNQKNIQPTINEFITIGNSKVVTAVDDHDSVNHVTTISKNNGQE